MPTLKMASTTAKGAANNAVSSSTTPYTTTLHDGTAYDPTKSLPEFLRNRLATPSAEFVENWCEPARQILTSSRYSADRIANIYPRRDAMKDGKLLAGIEVAEKWATDESNKVLVWSPSENASELLGDPRAFFEAGTIDYVPVSEVVTVKRGKYLVQPHYRSNYVRELKGEEGARDMHIVNCEFTALISEKRIEIARRLGLDKVSDLPEGEKSRQVRVSVRTRGRSKGDTCIENRSIVSAVGQQFYIGRLMALLDCLRQAQTMHTLAEMKFEAKAWTTVFMEIELGYYGYAYPLGKDATDAKRESQSKTEGLHAFALSVNDAEGIATDLPESYLFRGEVLCVG